MTDVQQPDQLQLRPTMNGRRQLGTTRVANEVVASIAAFAALQVPGIHAM